MKKKVDNPFAILKRLFAYIFKNYKIHCLLVFIFIIISSLASVIGTMFMKNLIDDYIVPFIKVENPEFSKLFNALVIMGSAYLIGVISTWAYSRIMVNVTQGTLRNLRDDLFKHMEKLSIKFFDTNSHGDIMSIYTNDTDTLRQLISQSIPQLLSGIITIIGILVSMIILSIPLTIVTLVMVVIMLIVTKRIS